jgi:hypothetical protein
VSAPGAALRERIERLRGTLAYRAYEEARATVLELGAAEASTAPAGAGVTRPSRYWREELANFEYMLDASPLIVERLRHHSYHVTGLWPYHYRPGADRLERQIREKLRALREAGGDSLLVPESPLLGGFGFEVDGGLYNLDTLKFFEALIAMDRAGSLESFRTGERAVAWEIGAGWGGFAYQFKTLFPASTYVISDLPELFLFSAVYLRTAFPEARIVFAGAGGKRPGDWREADFVFVPHHRPMAEAPLERLDLTLNMVSFQEMTTEQVRSYVGTAAELGSSSLYSLNRSRSFYNTELSSVPDLIGERFALSEVAVLDVDYTTMLPSGASARLRSSAGRALRRVRPGRGDPYRHLVGRRP